MNQTIVPEYLDDEHRDIRKLLAEISDVYAEASKASTLDQMRTILRGARMKLYDVDFRIYHHWGGRRRQG